MVETLKALKYDFPKADASFNPENFYSWYSSLGELQSTDVSTKKGLEKILGIVQDPIAQTWSTEELDNARKQVMSIAGDQLTKYSTKNISGLTATLPKEVQVNYALQMPSFEIGGDEAYNAVGKKKKEFEEASKKIKEDAGKYLESRLQGLDEVSKMFWAPRSKEIIEYDLSRLQDGLTRELMNYGPSNFVAKTVAETQEFSKKYSTEMGEVEKKAGKDFEAKLRDIAEKEGRQRNLTATEELEISSKYDAEREAISEKYKSQLTAIATLQKSIGQLQQLAYESIDRKKKAEEKAKEESKKDKK